jgi:hypothetical protein
MHVVRSPHPVLRPQRLLCDVLVQPLWHYVSVIPKRREDCRIHPYYLVPPRCNALSSTLSSRRPTSTLSRSIPYHIPSHLLGRPGEGLRLQRHLYCLSLPPKSNNARPSISPRSPRRLHPAGPFALLALRHARPTYVLVGRVRVTGCILMPR